MKHAAGIFLVRKDGKILIGHPSGHDKNFYSIPKGKMDGDETPWQGAMRETYEETNIDLKPVELDKIYELKMVKYKHGRKCIHPFVIFEAENNLDFNSFEIKCNAIIPEDASWNAGKPEFDRFAWESIDSCKKLLHDTQVDCLDTVQKLYDKLNTNE
jgi:8-oxo-dGTP pyrophosphatase MutT (NUDIX family)